ncbi:MAG: DOMON-like domain-containing protein [Steroidobacteraceae bacterium]
MHALQPADRGVTGIEGVRAGCTPLAPGRLQLRWEVSGELGWLVVPAPGPRQREDGLWRHTCFEAFIAPAARAPAYLEVNLAPSLAWATYSFSDYRAGQRVATEASLVNPRLELDAHALLLEAELHWDCGPGARVGLSAVLEELGGTLSYWALAHAPGRPDFHRRECFVLQLP